MTSRLVHVRRPAMASLFEAWLIGDDVEHLTAVGETLLDEIERVEQLLSRFDRTAELFRLNREAGRGPTLVSRELFAVLTDCATHHAATAGYFDPCVGSACTLPFGQAVVLDAERRTVAFADPGTSLDLGGYGKGYALDVAASILVRFDVGRALLHGGTSSVLARGRGLHDRPWCVDLRDGSTLRIELHDESLSTSAAFAAADDAASDLIDPVARRPIETTCGWTVVCRRAAEAEAWSTALTAMGPERAEAFVERCRTVGDDPLRIYRHGTPQELPA